MLEVELRHYKRWCFIFVFTTLFSTGLAAYAYDMKVDPMCHNVEAKYQKILLTEGEAAADEVMDEYPNPAEEND